MALYNEGLEHEMVDGALFQDEVNARSISSVPAVYAGDTLVHIGKASLGELLAALEGKIGAEAVSAEPIRRSYDLIVVGGGVVACEAATWMSALGCDVTMLVRGPRLLSAAESFASRLIESFTSEASYEGE